MNGNKSIDLKCISKSYGDIAVLKNICITFSESFPYIIMGASGIGKTTLMRIITGLEKPDQGEVIINGQLFSSPSSLQPPWLRNVSAVFQTPALWPHMSIAENISFGLNGFATKKIKLRTEEILEKFELTDLRKRYPNQISGGQARRVALARGLAPGKDFIIMDEPLTNMDEALKRNMLNIIKEEIEEAKSLLIYITHNIFEAYFFGGALLSITNGKLNHNSK